MTRIRKLRKTEYWHKEGARYVVVHNNGSETPFVTRAEARLWLRSHPEGQRERK